MAVEDINRLYKTTKDPFLNNIATLHHSNGDTLDYLYKTLIDTRKSVEYLKVKADLYTPKVEYPQNPLARNMSGIAQLINAGAETKVYYVSIDGFDTHALQFHQHNDLLKTVCDSLAAFIRDLRQGEQLNSTLILIFSEFGRRVKENSSAGTDHGTANNVLLVGGRLKKAGFLNEGPDLEHLENDDLTYTIDFRSIYATILDNWLKVNSEKVLGRKFEKLEFV